VLLCWCVLFEVVVILGGWLFLGFRVLVVGSVCGLCGGVRVGCVGMSVCMCMCVSSACVRIECEDVHV